MPESTTTRFTGTIPAEYERGLGPVIFAPFAEDMARRITAKLNAGRLLETACGTGILTRRLDEKLAPDVRITATDLNEAMLTVARQVVPASPRLDWQVADAAALPFEADSMDAVACQFGLMFVPDKALAFREARRVLRRGGWFFSNVWRSLEENPFARIAHTTITRFFRSNPPTFYQTPFGFHDEAELLRLFRAHGFDETSIERVKLPLATPTARTFAGGLVEGNPVAAAIQDAGLPYAEIVDAVTAALIAEGGDAPLRSEMNALVCTARAA